VTDATSTIEEVSRRLGVCSRHGTLIGATILLAAVIIFCFEIHSIALLNRWSLDVLY
jgi:hypothetical protein